MDVPVASLPFQGLIAPDGTLPAGPAHRQLHGQHRQAHDDQKQQIHQHKPPAAVLAHHIGKLPHIADAHGAARAHQQEAQPGLKGFSFLHFSLSSRSDSVTRGIGNQAAAWCGNPRETPMFFQLFPERNCVYGIAAFSFSQQSYSISLRRD